MTVGQGEKREKDRDGSAVFAFWWEHLRAPSKVPGDEEMSHSPVLQERTAQWQTAGTMASQDKKKNPSNGIFYALREASNSVKAFFFYFLAWMIWQQGVQKIQIRNDSFLKRSSSYIYLLPQSLLPCFVQASIRTFFTTRGPT